MVVLLLRSLAHEADAVRISQACANLKGMAALRPLPFLRSILWRARLHEELGNDSLTHFRPLGRRLPPQNLGDALVGDAEALLFQDGGDRPQRLSLGPQRPHFGDCGLFALIQHELTTANIILALLDAVAERPASSEVAPALALVGFGFLHPSTDAVALAFGDGGQDCEDIAAEVDEEQGGNRMNNYKSWKRARPTKPRRHFPKTSPRFSPNDGGKLNVRHLGCKHTWTADNRG